MVTIIISAYNAGKTLKKAIQSCLDLTYKDLEVLVVNDCSTDNTLKVAQSFSDPRVRIISNETNLGVGLSRRRGTKEAKGEYTIFLDSDDWLNKDFVETLYNKAIEYNADVVSSGMKLVYSDKYGISTYEKEEVLTGLQDLQTKSVIKRWLNNKLVRRELWDKVEYSGRRFVEDTQTCYFLMFFTKVLVNLPYVGYNYWQNPASLCHKSSALKRQIYSCLAAKDMCEFLEIHSDEKNYIAGLKGFAMHYNKIWDIKDEDTIDNYQEELKEINSFIDKNKQYISAN